MRRWAFVFVLLLCLPILHVAESVLAADQPQRSIVVFRDINDEGQKRTHIESSHGTWKKDLRLIRGAAADLTQTQIDDLKKDPHVLRIDPDVKVFALDLNPTPLNRSVGALSFCSRHPSWPGCHPTPTPTPKATPTPTQSVTPTPTPTPTNSQVVPWGITKIHSPDVWGTDTGNGVSVGVIDTGISTTHPDLSANIAGCVSFVSYTGSCEDDNGHGSHVSGIIAAVNNTVGVVGVAPQARLYALKVLDSQGSGYLSDVISGLNWAATNHLTIVNMSMGTGSDVQSFHDAVTAAYNAGVIEVAAAGNSGPGSNTVIYPAAYPEVIAVAATDINNNVPSWSSRGPQVDIAAPGVNIYSTYRGGEYATLSGTSMATPHVTGAVALRLATHPGESFSQVYNELETSADPLPWGSTLVGGGLVDIQKLAAL